MNTLNGKLLKKMFTTGSEFVSKNYEYINELNVFPVPDGDTGSNMMITIQGAVEATASNETDDLQSYGKQFSRGLLMNARGNSGVIFSQIIKGFTSSFKEGQTEITIPGLVECFVNAKLAAYNSVTTPVEGTILTVIRVISEEVSRKASSFSTVEEFFNTVIVEGEKILAKTTEILPELKEIGVVDSGGYGLCRFLEGMKEAISASPKTNSESIAETSPVKTINKSLVAKNDVNEGFGYCCEFIMTIGSKVDISQNDKEEFNLKKLKNSLAKIGNSMVVVVDNDIVKVHIHTCEPDRVLRIASQFGEFDKIKIDNMTNEFLARNPGTKLGDINTGKTTQKQKTLKNETRVVATVPSQKFVEIYNDDFKITETINTEFSGNPSIQEFLSAINNTKSRNVILVVDDSNALLAAKEAAALVTGVNIEIIPAKNIATSYLCCLTFNPVSSFKDNVSKMIKTCKNTDVGRISTSSKNVKYSHLDVQKGDVIGIVDKKILFAGKSVVDVAKKLIDHLLKDGKLLLKRKRKDVYIFYGVDAQVRNVRDIEKYINETYSIKCIAINGNQPIYSFYLGIR